MDPAIFASSFHPHHGGVEELVRQLAKEEQRAGNRPLVLTMRWPKTLAASEDIEGVPVRRHVFRTPEATLKAKISSFGLAPLVLGRLASQLRRHGSTVVHVQCVSGNAWYAEKVARLLRLPLVVTLQGELTMDASDVYQRSSVLLPLLSRLLRSADVVTACSAATLREAEEACGVPLEARGVVVHNGVRISDFTGATPLVRQRPYVLSIGRLVRQKGFDVLLRAFRDVARERAGIDLVIAGDGVERAALSGLVRDLGLHGRVGLLGAVERPAVPSLFRGATAFVLPSRHEPFGIVNLEAMAAHVPVIATAVGGVPEFIEHEVTGLLVAADAPAALAVAIGRVLDEVALRRRLVEHGFGVASAHDWSHISAQYRDLYGHAVGSR